MPCPKADPEERLPTSHGGWSRARRTGCACVRHASRARKTTHEPRRRPAAWGKPGRCEGQSPADGARNKTVRAVPGPENPVRVPRREVLAVLLREAHTGDGRYDERRGARNGDPAHGEPTVPARPNGSPPACRESPARAWATCGAKACTHDDPGASSRPGADPECRMRGAEKTCRARTPAGRTKRRAGTRNRTRARPRAGRATSKAQANAGKGTRQRRLPTQRRRDRALTPGVDAGDCLATARLREKARPKNAQCTVAARASDLPREGGRRAEDR